MKSEITILVVDDNALVLDFVVIVLQDANFNVLQANNSRSGLKIASDFPGGITLLICDVTLQRPTGPEMAEVIVKARPEMHVLFMTGFTREVVEEGRYNWSFIQKPFGVSQLMATVVESITSK